jgi:hypothetical protein
MDSLRIADDSGINGASPCDGCDLGHRDTDDSILDVGSLGEALQEHGSELAPVEILGLFDSTAALTERERDAGVQTRDHL